MTKLTSVLTTILLFKNFSLSQAKCVALEQPCMEDCECCGYLKNPGTKCERRFRSLGLRCYPSGGLNSPCSSDADCRSQYCENGLCQKKFPHNSEAKKCPLPSKHIAKKSGSFFGGCGKPVPIPTNADAEMATDGDKNTFFISQRGLDAGVTFKLDAPLNHATLKAFKVCNSNCEDCDPASFLVRGICRFDDTWTTIQEGDISFPGRRTCVEVKVNSPNGPPLCTHYTVTFPTQKGVCSEVCDNGERVQKSCPLEISELELFTNCIMMEK